MIAITLVSLLATCISSELKAQDSTAKAKDGDVMTRDSGSEELDSSEKKTRSYFEAGISYQSNNVYLGRKDSAVLPYFIPTLSYYHKSGFYATVSADYLKDSSVSRVDAFSIAAGFSFTTGNYSGDFTASKYFYNSQSTSVTSAIKGSLAYQNSYDLGFIKPGFTATLDLGTNPDFVGNFSLEHSFYLLDDKLEVIPTFQANASTLNYYNNYYKTRRFTNRKAKKMVSGTVAITGTAVNASEFRMLDYEPSLPIIYKAGKWTFSFTPTYAIPVNPSEIDLNYVYSTGPVVNTKHLEKLSNSFFWILGFTVQF
jgi:hypothetical protein